MIIEKRRMGDDDFIWYVHHIVYAVELYFYCSESNLHLHFLTLYSEESKFCAVEYGNLLALPSQSE